MRKFLYISALIGLFASAAYAEFIPKLDPNLDFYRIPSASAPVDLATSVTGVLPIGNGGTGAITGRAGLTALSEHSGAADDQKVLRYVHANGRIELSTEAAGYFTDNATDLYLTTLTDNFIVGVNAAILGAKASFKSTSDAITAVFKMNAGQTADIVRFVDSADATKAKIDASGNVHANGFIATGAGSTVIEMSDAGVMRSTTTSGHTYTLQVYDNNTGPAYVNAQRATNGNTPTWEYIDFPSKWKATVLSPVEATSNFTLDRAAQAGTITQIGCMVDPAGSGESVVLTINECDADGDSCAGVDGATTITCGNTWTTDDGALSNAAYDANDVMTGTIGTVTGTVSQLFVQVNKKETVVVSL